MKYAGIFSILSVAFLLNLNPCLAKCPGYTTQSFNCNDARCSEKDGFFCNKKSSGKLICSTYPENACLACQGHSKQDFLCNDPRCSEGTGFVCNKQADGTKICPDYPDNACISD